MVTMREVVEDAAEEIGAKTAEIPLESDELQSGIRRCNDMLTEWDDIGIISGYNPVLNGDDVLEVDRNAVSAIKYNLAIRMAPSFRKPVSAALGSIAGSTLSRLEASGAFIGNVEFPDTLPMGSGNECPGLDTDRRFFNPNEKENF